MSSIKKTLLFSLVMAVVAGATLCGQEANAYPFYGNGVNVNPPGPAGGAGHGKFWRYNPAGRRGGPGKGWVWNPPGPGKYFFHKRHNCYR